MSPNISACRPFTGTASSAARTGPFAWNTHFKHPVSARIACTTPPALPTNRWPSSTVGCAKADGVAVEAERPLQLEIPDLLDAESGPRLRLEARVIGAGTPAVPRDGRARRKPDRTVRAVGARLRSGDGVGGAQVRGHRQALVAVHGEGDGHHRAGVERADDARGRHLPQRFLRRDARIELIVAAGAAFGVDRLTRDRLCVGGAWCHRSADEEQCRDA